MSEALWLGFGLAMAFLLALLIRIVRFAWIAFGPCPDIEVAERCPPGFKPHPCDLRNPPHIFIRDRK